MIFRPSRAAAALVLAAGAAAALLFAANFADDSPRAARWKKVEDAVNKGLPKTAIEELGPIIESAVKDKAFPEAIKAIAKKIFLEGQIQGGKPEERVTRMKTEIAKAPAEMKPPMEAVLAHWYWQYFQQNRWRFMNRTATTAPPGEDFTTWDLPRLFAEVDKHFTAALADDTSLKSIKIGTYDALLEKGTVPDAYRPTLYDFLAFEALAFYTSGEQGIAKPQDAFELDAASPILAGVDEFLAWKPVTTDAESPKFKAVKLFQAVLTYHKADADKSAFLDADIQRLNYAKNVCFGEVKLARYKAAMKALAEKYADHPLSALARLGWASAVHEENDFVEARAIALQGANAFPNSPGGKQCHNLVAQIEAKEISIRTERVWTEPYPVARVTYRNVVKAYFRVYPADWSARVKQGRWRPEGITDEDRKEFLRQQPVAAFAADLPATDDFHARTQNVPLPKDLKPGFYFLFASTKEDFSDSDNTISATDFWVSELAVVLRNRYDGNRVGGFVLTAKGGDPIPGATVRVWDRNQSGGFTLRPAAVQTDANGLFTVATAADVRRRLGMLLLVSHGDQSLAVAEDVYAYGNYREPTPTTATVLFTDRSLYRPGQTVRYKGICLDVNQAADNYSTMAGRPVTLTFFDVNGKEIAKQQSRTNDYGSFNGSFTAPRDRLSGHMTVRVTDGPNGQTGFNVEEYKRPKFQVTIDPPKEPAKLGGPVTVVGKALAYTGAAINGAIVQYRVTREVRYPIWWYDCFWWRVPPNRGTAQEIVHGSAMTAADGTFTVTFTAKPDPTVPEKDEPSFRFTVHADVTDLTGETRSGDKAVTVGYTALQANINRDSWLVAEKEFKLKITSQTLNGEGQSAKGTLKVYKLIPPETLTRPDILGQNTPVPRPIRRGGRTVVGIPPGQEAKPDPTDPRVWPLGEVIATKPFETAKDGTAEIALTLGKGYFRAVVETQDKFGKPVTAQDTLRVLDPNATKLGLKIPNLFDAPKWSLEPGQEFTAVWGTGYDRGRAFVEVEHRRKILQSFWTDPEKTQVQLKQAVTEAMRGGFTVRVTFVKENRAYAENRHVDVPWSNKDLTVKWERFVSRLEPGQKESYTAVVTGPKAMKVAAEFVAALYDESLDAYLPHDWLHKFNVFRYDSSNLNVSFQNVSHYLNQLAGQWRTDYRDGTRTYRHFPNEFTQGFWLHRYLTAPGFGGYGGRGMPAPASAAPMDAASAMGANRMALAKDALGEMADDKPGGGSQGPDLSKVSARKNLNETAFFFPSLTTGADGTVRMQFTMPEALTKWKFMGFAHDKQARSGYLRDDVVTAKDLMVQPNPPRFLREGDVLAFTVKVSNQSPRPQQGKVRLTFTDARTGKSVDERIGNLTTDVAFEIPAGESRGFAWTITVPDGLGPVIYKAVGASDKLSDGEEGMLPVLS
ncbi:MAG TPA: alpha-2-macroglobulin family protein, partial [Fimbriiglobus sp.]